MSTPSYAELPPAVDLATCVATRPAPPQAFAPAAESAETAWALLQRDLEG